MYTSMSSSPLYFLNLSMSTGHGGDAALRILYTTLGEAIVFEMRHLFSYESISGINIYHVLYI